MKKGISTQQLAFLAFAAVINIIGGYIALFLHLPIYLDSIGTILISAVLGPIYGMTPSLLSNLVLGMMGDVYAFYYLPVGMLLGALNGWLWNKPTLKKGGRLLLALIITLLTKCLHYCQAIRRHYLIRINRTCAAARKNTTWINDELFSCAITHRLYRPFSKHCFGSNNPQKTATENAQALLVLPI